MELKQIKTEYGKNVIPLEKAIPPFMKFNDGFGFKGILLYDTLEDKIQCHFCGEWFKQINNRHLRICHNGMTAEEYKSWVGIYATFGLTSLGTRQKFAEKSKANYDQKRPQINRGKRIYLKNEKRRLGKKTYMWQNKKGICEAQMKARLEHLRKIKGRPVKCSDDNALACALRRRYGSFNRAKSILLNG